MRCQGELRWSELTGLIRIPHALGSWQVLAWGVGLCCIRGVGVVVGMINML